MGLLGPNGAGKSTFLKLLVGELKPSRGQIEVLGETPFSNPRLHARLGFCPQQDALWEELTALEFVEFLLRLSGFEAATARSKGLQALERVLTVQRHAAGDAGLTDLKQAKAAEPVEADLKLLLFSFLADAQGFFQLCQRQGFLGGQLVEQVGDRELHRWEGWLAGGRPGEPGVQGRWLD